MKQRTGDWQEVQLTRVSNRICDAVPICPYCGHPNKAPMLNESDRCHDVTCSACRREFFTHLSPRNGYATRKIA